MTPVAEKTEITPDSARIASEFKILAQHSSHYLAGLVGGFAVGLVSFPIFTRIFTVAEYGLMDLAQRVVGLLVIASKLGLQNSVLRFYNRDEFATNPRAARSYYSTMFFGALGTSLLIGISLLALATFGRNIKDVASLVSLASLLAALVVLRSVAPILWGFLRIEEKTKLFNVSVLSMRIATVLVVCALLAWTTRTVRTYFGGVVLVEAAAMALLTGLLLQRGVLAPESFDTRLFRAGVAYGLPLVVYEFAFAVLGSADRFLVRHFLGPNALGFYSVAYGLAQHTNELLLTPLSLAIAPIYFRIWNSDGAKKTSQFLRMGLDFSLMAAIGILAAASAAAHDVVILLASAKYAGVDHLIPIILAGLLVYAAHIFVAAGLLIHKRTLEMAGLLIVAAVLNIGLNCLLLPGMGLIGGAVATFLSYAACIVLLSRASSRVLPLDMDFRKAGGYLAAAVAAWFAASRIELGTPILNLPAKGAVVFTIYLAGLYAIDERVRRAAKWGWEWSREWR